MSDVGLQMQETIAKTKLMKGHAAAKEKIKEMEGALSMIKQAFFNGEKRAEDMASNNEEFNASEQEKSKADKIINKLRVGWNSESSDIRRERIIDKLHSAAEDINTAPVQINSNSPELQDFSTNSISDSYEYR